MPYDSLDLNSLPQPDAGEDWDEMQRVSDSTGKADMRNETSPGLGRNKKGAFVKVEKLNHSFSVNNSEETGSFDLGKKQLTDLGSDKNVSGSQHSSTKMRRRGRNRGKVSGSRASSISSKDLVKNILFNNQGEAQDFDMSDRRP